MKDVPGAFSSILVLLGKRVNLVGTNTYQIGEGAAIFSGFAEALSPAEEPGSLRKLVMSSPAALECEVKESSGGLLVDSFRKGIETENGDCLMLFTWEGINRMFDGVTELLGSGGKVMLFNQGTSMGESVSAEILKNVSGSKRGRWGK